MKGIILKAFCRFVRVNTPSTDQWQLDNLNSVLSEDSYFSSEIYDDTVFSSVFKAYLAVTHETPIEILRSFGRFLFAELVSYYGDLIANYTTPYQLLKNLDGIIHVEVKKVLSGAQPPQFLEVSSTSRCLKLEYRSDRSLCYLAEGLLEGAQNYFAQNFVFFQCECLDRGDLRCVFQIQFNCEGVS